MGTAGESVMIVRIDSQAPAKKGTASSKTTASFFSHQPVSPQ